VYKSLVARFFMDHGVDGSHCIHNAAVYLG